MLCCDSFYLLKISGFPFSGFLCMYRLASLERLHYTFGRGQKSRSVPSLVFGPSKFFSLRSKNFAKPGPGVRLASLGGRKFFASRFARAKNFRRRPVSLFFLASLGQGWPPTPPNGDALDFLPMKTIEPVI